jgi:tetratricopeptide (TPR) repeat protein
MRLANKSAALLMRLLMGLALATALFLPSSADDFTDNAALDRLFAELKLAPDAAAARKIDQEIWHYWMTPLDAEIGARLLEAAIARDVGGPQAALPLLNKLVEDYPGYAEGWNQRATLYFIVGDFDASIADCARVLELEPRHFGALTGRAQMYLLQGKRPLALRDMATALAIHPFLSGRENFPELQEITRI